MKFQYQAKTQDGEPQIGFVEAGTRDLAASILSSHGLFVLKLEEVGKERWYERISWSFGGVRRQDLVIFTRQLAILLESQISLGKALGMLYDQTRSPALKEALFQISQDVASGLTLSQAMERQNNVFSQFFVSMIRSGEVTGKLNEVAQFLAEYTEQEAILIGKARSALTYPAILGALFLIVSGIMVTVVFPQVMPIFEESGVELPWFSRLLIGGGAFLSRFWLVVLLFLGVGAGIVADYFRTSEGQAVLDDLKVKAPLVKKIYVPITITRFGNAATMLAKGGVPLAQAMEIVADTIDNVIYKDVLHEVANDVRGGELLSTALERHKDYFPDLVAQMVAVGEVSGQLDRIFERITNFYRREADTVVANITDLIQPLLMVVIGIMVGLLFSSILIPLYQLTSSVQ